MGEVGVCSVEWGRLQVTNTEFGGRAKSIFLHFVWVGYVFLKQIKMCHEFKFVFNVCISFSLTLIIVYVNFDCYLGVLSVSVSSWKLL